ncbi:MAG TPA: ABC transporter permease, partial [Terriglobales bacterium]|nr:ABC transporter permease [Terriglobales bacterium]
MSWRLELRQAARGLRRAPGLTAAAVITLGLGIGVTAALSSAVYAGAWRPLPFPSPQQLVAVYGGARRSAPSPADIADLKARSHTLADVAVYRLKQVTLSRPAPVRRVRALLATPELLATLEVAPRLGRGFSTDELQPGGERVALLSDHFWREEFHADRGAVGGTLMLDGQPATIIGVLPAAMEPLMEGNAVMLPLQLTAAEWADREARMYTAVARLRPGATLGAARGDAAAAGREMARLHSEDRKLAFELTPLHQDMVGQLGATPGLLIATAGLILGLVCANVAGLLVARAVGRRRETAVRLALGASRWRVARQAAAEAALLGAAGGALGGWLAWAMLDSLGWLHPPYWLRTVQVGAVATAGLCVAASVAAAGLCSLIPMAVTARTTAAGVQAGATATRPGRTRGRLVAVQLALALVLAMAAGVMIRSVAKLTAMPVGFDPQQVLTTGFGLPGGMTPAAENNFYQQILERAQALPGVRAAALANSLPFDDSRLIIAEHDGARASLRWSA